MGVALGDSEQPGVCVRQVLKYLEGDVPLISVGQSDLTYLNNSTVQ